MLQAQHQVAPAALLRNSALQEVGQGLADAQRDDVEAASSDQLLR
jgi:hypothetical protein